MKLRYSWLVISICLAGLFGQATQAEEVDVAALAKAIKAIGPKGAGHPEAIQASKILAKADVGQLPQILGAMKDAGRLSENWFRAAVETVAEREVKQGGKLPVDGLEKFLADTEQSPRARRLAYELLAGIDSSAEERLIPGLLNDPSLELRRDAVSLAIAQAGELEEAGKNKDAAKRYLVAFTASRSLDQIKTTSEKLRELNQKFDLPKHMGFVLDWNLVGPFDNTDKKGFDEAYPPEKGVSLDATYQGKLGKVKWTKHVTSDQYGIVDLNVIYDRPKDEEGKAYKLTDEHKGAVAYAYAEFKADEAKDVDLRIGCINGNKVWLNGELVTENHVYHANTAVDQYLGTGRLKKGTNKILVKICQNEQSESWAQRWQFQLRVCDHLGTAVLSLD